MSRCTKKFICFFSIASLIAVISQPSVTLSQSPNCTENKCTYFPLVNMPSPISVMSTYYWTESKFRQLVIGGEFRNNSSLTIREIVLNAKVYYSGQMTFDVQFQPIISATLPGQLNVYRFNAGQTLSDFQNYSTTIEVITTTVDTSNHFRNLQIATITSNRSYDARGLPGTTITITIRNNYQQPIYNVHVDVWSLSKVPEQNFAFCSLAICSGHGFVTIMSPNQFYTNTLHWASVQLDGSAIPPNMINAVAQGTTSP